MLKIVAQNKLKPGKKAEFLKLARELVKKSRMEEGNIDYHLYEDKNDECIVAFLETWKDEKAISFHNETTHYKEICEAIMPLTEDGSLNIYQIIE